MRRNLTGKRLLGLVISILALGTMLLGAAGARGAVLSSTNGVISYIADQGERNDTLVSTNFLLGQPTFTFTDADANPITIGPGNCGIFNGVGTCTQAGISTILVNVRDRDDTLQIATAGEAGAPPVTLPTTLIGGRGVDVIFGGLGSDKLKGNNGRDSLRGRKGVDFYKGGRGSDTLQTLDGERDGVISCGDGSRDLLRADGLDPKAKSCELSNRGRGKRR